MSFLGLPKALSVKCAPLFMILAVPSKALSDEVVSRVFAPKTCGGRVIRNTVGLL